MEGLRDEITSNFSQNEFSPGGHVVRPGLDNYDAIAAGIQGDDGRFIPASIEVSDDNTPDKIYGYGIIPEGHPSFSKKGVDEVDINEIKEIHMSKSKRKKLKKLFRSWSNEEVLTWIRSHEGEALAEVQNSAGFIKARILQALGQHKRAITEFRKLY